MSEEQVDTQSEPVVDNITDVEIKTQGGGSSISANMAEAPDPMDTQKLEMPVKFSNTEDPQQALLKAYRELEQQRGSSDGEQKAEAGQGTEVDSTPSDTEGSEAGGGDAPTDSADTSDTDSTGTEDGVSLEGKYTKLYHDQGGSLTEDQLNELSQQTGETLSDIKEYIEFKKGRTDADIAESDRKVMEAIGGVEEYNKISTWANSNLPDDQLKSIETMLSNPELAEQGARVLGTLYQHQATIEPKKTVDGKGSGQAPDVYHSNAEEQEDMQNPLYKSSPKFRRQVKDKMMRTIQYSRR